MLRELTHVRVFSKVWLGANNFLWQKTFFLIKRFFGFYDWAKGVLTDQAQLIYFTKKKNTIANWRVMYFLAN